MFVEMSCTCGASVQIDSENENGAWLVANRFSSSHVVCGFMSPVVVDVPEKMRRYDMSSKDQKEHE